jgi:HEPN domain-containing protein
MAEPSAADLRALAKMRIEDAGVLLEHRRYSAAYYLAGSSVECGLKAVIALSFRKGVIPSKRFVDKVYSHDLNGLIGTAGLKAAFDGEAARSARFKAHWAVVANWSEAARYETFDPFTATAMLQSVTDRDDGVLAWLKTHW